MLEISFSSLQTCFFPQNLWFIEGDSISFLNFLSYPFGKKGSVVYDLLNVKFAKKSYLTKCVVKAGFYGEDFLHHRIKIAEGIKYFSNSMLINSFCKHFNLHNSILDQYFDDVLNEEEKSIFSLAPLFLKSGNIWCVFIRDQTLSSGVIKQIEYAFLSKISNSKAIIFYTTESKNSLNFENENRLLI